MTDRPVTSSAYWTDHGNQSWEKIWGMRRSALLGDDFLPPVRTVVQEISNIRFKKVCLTRDNNPHLQ